MLDTEVKHHGFLQVDTGKVLSATVESLRAEDKLQVFSFKGQVSVSHERRFAWLFGGRQQLIVPAVVSYYLDLQKLTLRDVSYDAEAKLATVRLPRPELGDVAFQPERATTINGGVLTFSQAQVDALAKANYTGARRAMIAQAQGAGFVAAARRQAQADIINAFEIPLRVVGRTDVRIVATFR